MPLLENGLFYSTSVLFLVVAVIILYFKFAYTYWARKKVPFIKPHFPLGNMKWALPQGISFGTISNEFYQTFKKQGHKYGGVYAVADPHLVVIEPEYVKKILATNFQHFSDRGIYKNEKSEPYMVNIFTQDGDAWKYIRTKLSPCFTSNKLKYMAQYMVDSAKVMEKSLICLAEENADIDILEMAGKYTTDVIGTSIYGLDFNSLKNEESEFRKMGRRIFSDIGLLHQIKLFIVIYMPKVANILNIGYIPQDISEFFANTLKETIEHRVKNNTSRPDFLQLLIDLLHEGEITETQLIAEAFLFFQAGFETSSKTITFTLLELAKDQQAQDKVREEINYVLQKHDNDLSYDSLGDMKYLQQCMDETLRLWPAVTTITRHCTKSFEFDAGLTVEPGIGIMIPVFALHHDPDYFPYPEKFDPERFSDENKRNAKQGIYLPFGDGPRICIGMRFGLTQSKIGLATILRRFKVTVSEKTQFPIKLNPNTFVIFTMGTIYLKLEQIK